MDRARVSSITHGDLPLHNPFGPERLDEVIDLLELGRGEKVLDVGCGTGELLIRLAERFGCHGVGIDSSPGQIEEARRRSRERVYYTGLDFVVADVRSEPLPDGPFALAACIGSMHALGDGLAPALERLAAVTAPGGHVLIGDGYWRRPPQPEYLEALGATAGELPDYAGLMAAGEAAGLEAVYATASTQEEWDRYEWQLILNGLRFAAQHPDDPDAAEVAEWARAARRRYLAPGGRETLGFALVLFACRAP